MPKTYAVYLSGPYTKPDPAANVHRAAKVWHRLAGAGFVVYSPAVMTHTLHLIVPKPYEFWMTQDLAILERFDVVARLNGHSSGADRECDRARQLDIPVITGKTSDELFNGLVAWRRKLLDAAKLRATPDAVRLGTEVGALPGSFCFLCNEDHGGRCPRAAEVSHRAGSGSPLAATPEQLDSLIERGIRHFDDQLRESIAFQEAGEPPGDDSSLSE